MNATQQHMLDLYRTAQHQEPAPLTPGEGQLRALRAFRTWRDFRAVVDERAAARRSRRHALLSFLRPGTRTPAHPVARAAARPAAEARTAEPASPCASGARRNPGQDRDDRLDDRLGRPAQC
ncbi:hypothetical protein [Streptomyces olivoreticuli]|uniref:hypothetical protein n=1 Tax=Streptomyces olivoreticuli TaxID=68246 RepID=UPI0019674416|nr:hypothetical protein [Streptomyces olivoreticuli]